MDRINSTFPERLTAAEAARFIACSEYTIKDLARRGLIPHYKIGNRLRFNRSSLEKWIEQQEEENYKAG